MARNAPTRLMNNSRIPMRTANAQDDRDQFCQNAGIPLHDMVGDHDDYRLVQHKEGQHGL
jgi:hypothetical protein